MRSSSVGVSSKRSDTAMDVLETRYARAGDLRIAFQEFGRGPRMLIIPPLVTNIDVQWDNELFRRMLEHLGAFLPGDPPSTSAASAVDKRFICSARRTYTSASHLQSDGTRHRC